MEKQYDLNRFGIARTVLHKFFLYITNFKGNRGPNHKKIEGSKNFANFALERLFMLFNPKIRIGMLISFQFFFIFKMQNQDLRCWCYKLRFFPVSRCWSSKRSQHHTHSCGSFQIFARIFLIESCGRSNSEGGKEMRCVTTDRIECQATCESDKKLFEVRDMHCTA